MFKAKQTFIVLFFAAVVLTCSVSSAFAVVTDIKGLNINGNNAGIIPLVAVVSGTPSTVKFEYFDKAADMWREIGNVTKGANGFLCLWDTGRMDELGVSVRAADNLSPSSYFSLSAFVRNIVPTDIWGYRNPATGTMKFSTSFETYGETVTWPTAWPTTNLNYYSSSYTYNYTSTSEKAITSLGGSVTSISTNFTTYNASYTGTIKFKALSGGYVSTSGSNKYYTFTAIKVSNTYVIGAGVQTYSVNWLNIPAGTYIGLYPSYTSSYPLYLRYYISPNDSADIFGIYGLNIAVSGDVLSSTSFYSYYDYYSGCPIMFTISTAPPAVTQMEAGYSLDGGATFTSTVTGVLNPFQANTYDFTWNSQDIVSDNLTIGVRTFAGTWCSWYYESGIKITNKIFISATNSLGYGTIDFRDYANPTGSQQNVPYTVEISFKTPYQVTAPVEIIKDGQVNRRYAFNNWSDGGDRTHDISLKWGDPTLLMANYDEQVWVNVQTAHDVSKAFSGWKNANNYYRYSVTSPFMGASNTRYICSSWSATGSLLDGTGTDTGDFWLKDPTTIIWNWRTEYLLSILNQYGTDIGDLPGWHVHGSSIHAASSDYYALPQSSRYACTGWASSGSLESGLGSDTGTFTMTSATVINWIWQLQYSIVVRTNHGDVSPSGTLWVNAGNIITVEALPISDTANEKFVWNGWLAPNHTPYTGDQVFVYQVTESGVLEANWIARFYVNVLTNGSFPEGSNYSGLYSEGGEITIQVNPPSAQTGVRYLLSWVADGLRMEGALPSVSTPNPNTFVVFSPATITATWVSQYSLEIRDPEQVGRNMFPPIGLNWYYEGDFAYGRVDFSNNEIVCTGFTGTGSVTSGNMPYFKIAIYEPSVLQWNWAVRDVSNAVIHNWRSPKTIATNAFGTGCSLANKKADNSPVVAYTGAPVAGAKADGKTNPDSIRVAMMRNGEWQLDIVDSHGAFGDRIGLVLDSNDKPYVAYIKDNDPFVASYANGTWTVRNISAAYAAQNFISIAIDQNDVPHIAYYSPTDGALIYTTYDGTQWVSEIADTADNVGLYCDIEIMPVLNWPSIAYYDSTNGNLKYARRENGIWIKQLVDANGNVGRNCSMALDPSGVPYICYQSLTDTVDFGLKIAWLAEGNWIIINLSENSIVGYDVSMAIDDKGIIHISYRDFNVLRYAWYDGVAWGLDNDIAGNDATGMTSIALDGDRHPAILFWDGADLKLVDTSEGAFTGTIVTDVTATRSSSGGGGGCFVATAAFGSYSASAVTSLTFFRDSSVATSTNGSALVNLYYMLSPSTASQLCGSDAVRSFVRRILAD